MPYEGNEIKMKIKIYRVVILIFLISTLFTIYGFSNQNGTQSKGVSTRITEKILQFSHHYQELEKEEQKQVFNRTNAVIRKIAHFSIYALLGLLIMAMMLKSNIDYKRRFFITIIVGTVYAILDEFHQSFSPGRTPKITDVYIDMLGIILGILVMMLIKKVYYQYITKKLRK